ncbi:NADPH-dependent FMN reductase [Haloglycomyces albus]|uniref:NADPH-dependent FMN reductase n=1 Tax=Haloglycomyces albus TaxID=526067 RepID=UPI00046D6BC0|nr:NAD(P)H-dependent oxidoreductase [Haloglycomyces albus]
MSDNLNLAIIIGSTRDGRFGPSITEWFREQAEQNDRFNIDVIDLVDCELPDQLVDSEENIPRAVLNLSERLERADAFVMVTPEYNRSFPAPLKTAIDWFHSEWAAKPVSFVSYGGISGGLRGVEQLRLVLAELHATTIRDTVCFPNFWDSFDESGTLTDPEGPNKAAQHVLNNLAWWAQALSRQRAVEPYGQ